VIIDLEDAVAPGAKAKARASMRADFTDLPVYVRINPPGTPWHNDDIDAVLGLPFAAIIVPKAQDGAGLAALAVRAGATHPLIWLVETAEGLATARALAARPGVARLAFGSIDYCADLGCAHTRQVLLAARTELVLASRLAKLAAPVDGVTADVRNEALTEDDARHAAEMGFGGKLCIHPCQVAPVLRGLQPSADEIAWAESVLAAEGGVSMLGGMMIDDAVKQRAAVVLARRAPHPVTRV
jgi:citrate lyase subunit beta/citryl-CoA lyase